MTKDIKKDFLNQIGGQNEAQSRQKFVNKESIQYMT